MSKRTFGYLINKEPAIPCDPGSNIKIEHELVQQGNNLMLREVGKVNIQAQIESYRDSVDLGKMIERFKRGDEQALQRRSAQYFDATDMPTDMRDAIEFGRNVARTVAAAAQDQVAAAQDQAAAAQDEAAAAQDQAAAAQDEAAAPQQ